MKSPLMAKTRNLVIAGALGVAGFGGGAALVAGGVADAATSASSIAGTADPHSGETPLTGATAAKVKAAALAKYPGATIERAETDSDGVYEAHIVTRAGDRLVVQVDKSFKVTGTETFSDRGGEGHHSDTRGPESSTSSNT
jgi:hypothetical protein